MSLYKNCGWWKNSNCIFEFSVKSYVTNTLNLSCATNLLPSVINTYVSLMYELKKKKLERYWRVNLLGPGPRLMGKEFTGPRYHKGWETLFYTMSIMTSVLSDRPVKRHTFFSLHVHTLYSEYPPTMEESTWIWRRKLRRSVYSRRTERWELGWRILTFRNTPKKEIFLYISTFGREARMGLPSDEAPYPSRTEPSTSLLREPPKLAFLLTNYLL